MTFPGNGLPLNVCVGWRGGGGGSCVSVCVCVCVRMCWFDFSINNSLVYSIFHYPQTWKIP